MLRAILLAFEVPWLFTIILTDFFYVKKYNLTLRYKPVLEVVQRCAILRRVQVGPRFQVYTTSLRSPCSELPLKKMQYLFSLVSSTPFFCLPSHPFGEPRAISGTSSAVLKLLASMSCSCIAYISVGKNLAEMFN